MLGDPWMAVIAALLGVDPPRETAKALKDAVVVEAGDNSSLDFHQAGKTSPDGQDQGSSSTARRTASGQEAPA